jgi:hypothetical protein
MVNTNVKVVERVKKHYLFQVKEHRDHNQDYVYEKVHE